MTDPTPVHPNNTAEAAARLRPQMPDPHLTGAERPERPEPPSGMDARDAERASEFATHGDPTLARQTSVRGRGGVEWVRPTDVAARAGGALVGKGAELNTRLRDATLEGIREGRAQLAERLARRQQQIDPNTTVPARTQELRLGRTGGSGERIPPRRHPGHRHPPPTTTPPTPPHLQPAPGRNNRQGAPLQVGWP